MDDTGNKISWWRTDFSEDEIRKVADSIRNENISMGRVTEEFEDRLSDALDVPYVVATTNGSSALLMALMALGIKADDEVIVPNRTWIATAHAPLMLGAKPVLVDVLPDRPIMDTSALRGKINSRTKAIMPVQLNGRAVDMDEVWEVADEYGLSVVEDSAQGLFSRHKGTYMGTQSDAGCFSMSISKLVSTGQGGFIATRSEGLYGDLRSIRTQGVDDVHSGTPFLRMGFNFRYTDLQASIGLVQLEKIPDRIKRVIEIHEHYRHGIEGLGFLQIIPVNISEGEVPLHVEVLCSDRERIMAHLSSRGIQARPFYPDLHSASYLDCGSQFPNAEVFGKQGLVLPCGPGQTSTNIEKVLDTLGDYRS